MGIRKFEFVAKTWLVYNGHKPSLEQCNRCHEKFGPIRTLSCFIDYIYRLFDLCVNLVAAIILLIMLKLRIN